MTPWTSSGILQAKILEWVAFPFYPGIEHRSPTLQMDSLPAEPQGKPNIFYIYLEICMDPYKICRVVLCAYVNLYKYSELIYLLSTVILQI